MVTEHTEEAVVMDSTDVVREKIGAKISAKQWARRAGWVAIALLPMSVGWAMVPRWSAFTSPFVAQSGQAVTFVYPSDWPRPHITSVKADGVVLDIAPCAPSGWRGLWEAQILRKDFSHWNTAHVAVEMFAHPRDYDEARDEFKLRQKLAAYCAKYNKTFTLAPLAHPLGKGFQIALASPGFGDLPTLLSRNYFVFPAATDPKDQVEICVFCTGDEQSMPQIQALMEQIARSVRVVPK